jgi:hypothetical protein
MKSQLINAPAMADGSSSATPHQIDPVPRSPSKKKAARDRRRPDPLALVWAPEIVAMLEAAPGMRPVAVFKELHRRHPEISQGVRRTLERRIKDWRTLNDLGCERWLAAAGMTKEAALLRFNSVPVTVSTICRISFVWAQARIEAE